MNFAGCIFDNFIMLRVLHPQELIFGRSMLQKRTSWLPKLVIYSPVQTWFRNSEVLCKIASQTVHCLAAEAAILKNLQWKAGKGAEVNRDEWEFTNGTAIFRSFRLVREKTNTSDDFHLFRKLSGGMSCIFGFCWQLVNAIEVQTRHCRGIIATWPRRHCSASRAKLRRCPSSTVYIYNSVSNFEIALFRLLLRGKREELPSNWLFKRGKGPSFGGNIRYR